jgi:hypothetical protein
MAAFLHVLNKWEVLRRIKQLAQSHQCLPVRHVRCPAAECYLFSPP